MMLVFRSSKRESVERAPDPSTWRFGVELSAR